jgi:hypothetical protein
MCGGGKVVGLAASRASMMTASFQGAVQVVEQEELQGTSTDSSEAG